VSWSVLLLGGVPFAGEFEERFELGVVDGGLVRLVGEVGVGVAGV
jgi:hypothetical protein